jgi:hypothetical protein
MTQRLQGCENFNDVINVAELFAPNIAPGIAGRLYVLDREPWQMRCVAQWLSPVGEETTFHRTSAGPCVAGRATAGER